MKKFSLAVLAALSTTTYASEDITNPLSFSATAGYTFGGDTLGTLVYEDDSDNSVKAGSGLILGGGFNNALSQTFDIRLNASIHLDSADAENGDLTFSRFAWEAIPYYKANEQIKLGLGVGIDSSVELENDFGNDIEFDNAGKFIVSGMYTFENWSASLELRYSVVDYEVSKIGRYSVANELARANKIDANHVGILLHWNF
ncbi:hypothetical protein [Pseudoalteromonas ardens]|uniref:Outer membrane protein beta-barrel domain-containing protein n=2 Tax=Pseudoalteromonas rubra TaxID=43658 RepID=A0A0L0ENA4_9GAMM|nr:hypothetical protein [Pseudoalteromonas sp. R96]KNC65840.1 hypothetical protein AC626_20705 [Pseudoalteromonas rubra]MDK1314340.1 hypothetical protein [Pseudoalteromonas sp. R96]